MRISITEANAGEQSKLYLWTMESHGLEFGHGPAGEYAAHAHTKVVDVVFAPDGLTVAGKPARLAVVLPNTLFGPVDTAPFWFLKFFPAPCDPTMPDKTDSVPLDRTCVRRLMLAGSRAEYRFDLFDPRDRRTTSISLVLAGRMLSVESPVVGRVVLN